MGLLLIFCFFAAVVFALLHDGAEGKPTWYLAVAWATGVLALHALATLVILNVHGDWDEPTSYPFDYLVDPTVGIVTLVSTVAVALLLRRKAVVLLALATSPFLAWYWSPVYLSS